MSTAWRAFLLTLFIVLLLTFAIGWLGLHAPIDKVGVICAGELVFFLLFARPKPAALESEAA